MINTPIDCAGNEVKVGDLVVCFHYKSIIKGRHEYMWKQVIHIGSDRTSLIHLPVKNFKDPERYSTSNDNLGYYLVISRLRHEEISLKRKKLPRFNHDT
jgi:hypothetical protein